MSNNDDFIKQYNNEIYAKTKKYQKSIALKQEQVNTILGITDIGLRNNIYILLIVSNIA